MARRRVVHWPLLLGLAGSLGCGGRTLDESSPGAAHATGGGASHGGASGSANTGGAVDRAHGGNASAGANASAGGSVGAGGSCSASVELFALPPLIEFLTDTSLSMNRALEGTSTRRWQFVREALSTAFLNLPEERWAGIACFPNIQLSVGSSVCFLPTDSVPIAALAPAQRELARVTLDAKQTFGSTPTEDAYAYALERLKRTQQRGSRYVVLTTDGAPTYGRNCSGTGATPVDTAPLVQAVKVAQLDGVRTFVVGLGAATESAWMSQVALAGGSAPPRCEEVDEPRCHYQIQGEEEPSAALARAYADIQRQTLGCVFAPRDSSKAIQAMGLRHDIWLVDQDGTQIAPVDDDCVTTDPLANTLTACSKLCSQIVERGLILRLTQPCP